MSSEKAIDLLNQALEIQDPVERSGFLKGACTDDPELLAHVQKLLAAHAAAGDAFPTDPGAEATILDPTAPGEGPGSQIGKYKLLQVIGEGGMGVVYLAAEEGAIHRKVAFKIIKLGMDTKSVVARFEAERQALALMDHRNIAKVFDAGATDTGRPFFVMELVKGIPITEYCDKHQLTVEQRLELFIPVCEAIQHAHHKGIIHRDIKPSNVLVAHFDGKPVPMVIDFGIAKATHQRLTEKTQWTEFGQFIGTPAYVSPEQAEGSQLDIDTRSDIYSLGVLLYELLTGSTPFPDKRLRSAGWKEMQRIILEDPPDRPSTRLSTLTQQERTKWTKVHPEGLGRISLLLRRELDWVVMKCLEKDRSRRYETANGLAMDLGRYLKGEPTIAVPPTRGYVLGKLVRKHRKTFALAAVIAVILAGATVISTWQMIVAKRERAIATAVSDFLDKDLLQRADVYGSDPFTTPHRDLKLLEVVNRASTNLTGKFTDQPVVEATIRLTLGKIYVGLGELLVAEPHLETALSLFRQELGNRDLRTADAAEFLGRVQNMRADFKEAEANLKEALDIRLKLLSARDQKTYESRLSLAHVVNNIPGRKEEADRMFEEIHRDAERHLAPNDDARLLAAEAYSWTTGHEDGLSFLESTRPYWVSKYGSNSMQVLDNDLQRAWRIQWSDWPKAAQIWTDVFERSEATFGVNGNTAEAMWRAGQQYFNRGISRKGRLLAVRAHELAIRQAGTNHPWAPFYGWARSWLERPYVTQLEAVRMDEELLREFKRLGTRDMNQSQIVANLYEAYWILGEPAKVLELARENLAFRDERFPTSVYGDHWLATHHYAFWHGRLGRWEEAAKLYAEALKLPNPYKFAPVNSAVTLAIIGKTNEAVNVMRGGLTNYVFTNIMSLDPILASALVLNTLPEEATAAWPTFAKAEGLTAPELFAFGLAHFRQGNLSRAIELLQPVVDHSPDPTLAVIAGSYLSVALKQAGQDQPARTILSGVSSRLERRLRNGDLASGNRDSQDWIWIALCLLSRREAELAVSGEVRTPMPDEAWATRQRQLWKPVKDRLTEASIHCANQRWPEARESYLKALRHPLFSWEAAEVTPDQFGYGALRFHMALAFLRTDDEENFRELCAEPPPAAFLAPLNRVTTALNFQKPDERVVVLITGDPEWQATLSGLADYVAGQQSDTLAVTFADAAEKCYHWGRQTVGLAMGAATLAKNWTRITNPTAPGTGPS
jgi:serine/threonine protein kinase